MTDIKPDEVITLPRVQLFRLGKGKSAIPIFGVRAYKSKYDNQAYEILHVPSNTPLCDGFYYISLARDIAAHLLEAYGEVFKEINARTLVGVLPQVVFDYLEDYRFHDTKHAPTITEYQESPEYQDLIVYRNGLGISERQGIQYAEELSIGDNSLGWLPDEAGAIPAATIRRLS